jgi:uncharacterized protein YdbL (DUF1318 family)
MRRLNQAVFTFFLSAMLGAVLSACVTINVYFPEAQATEAAQQFIDKVIGSEEADKQPGASIQSPTPSRWAFLANLLIPTAVAQERPDVNINSPAIVAIQQRMADRFEAKLRAEFDRGSVGLTQDAKIAARDLSKLPLKDRAALTALINEDNRDRDAVYREMAIANNRPEWEAQIRQIFAREWINKAKAGWYYQDEAGAWTKK